MVAQQLQGPACGTFRRRAAGGGHQMRLGPAVELGARHLAVRRPAMHRDLQTMLAERTARAFHSCDGHIKHFGNVHIAQFAAFLAGVCRQQDLRSLSFARCRLLAAALLATMFCSCSRSSGLRRMRYFLAMPPFYHHRLHLHPSTWRF